MQLPICFTPRSVAVAQTQFSLLPRLACSFDSYLACVRFFAAYVWFEDVVKCTVGEADETHGEDEGEGQTVVRRVGIFVLAWFRGGA